MSRFTAILNINMWHVDKKAPLSPEKMRCSLYIFCCSTALEGYLRSIICMPNESQYATC